MYKCETGKIFTKSYKKGAYYMLRLNIVDTEATDSKRYKHKVISTGLPAKRKNKAAAEAKLNAEIEKYNLNSDIYHVSLTDYCDRWMNDKCLVVEKTTWEGYDYRVRHIKEFFGSEKALKDVTAADVREFYNWLLTKKVSRYGTTEDGYSNRTIKDTATLLSAILADAVLMELLRKNPAAGIKAPQRPASREQRAYLAADEVAAFRAEIAGHRLETPFLMALCYGMRREEIVGLRWSSIREGKIYIEHTVAHVKTTVAKDRAKTSAGYRAYPVTQEIKTRLYEIKKQQDLHRSQMGQDYYESDYIFTWEDGRPYAPDYLTKSFKKIVRKSEVLDDSLTLHSLRASCVSILIHSGVDIKDTQVWVGHADIATTMNVYARTNEREQKTVANFMEKMVFA